MVRTLALATLLLSLSACASMRPMHGERDLVVLLHGMGRSPLSMAALDVSLRRAGYRVLNVGYNSQRPSVAEIGAQVTAEIEDALEDEPAPRVHYVGHSLGTVVVRWIAANGAPGTSGRAVFLAPPSQGSASADRWADWIGWALPPIRELRTTGGTAVDLGAPDGLEVAVIAGSRDRKVSVEETCLEGADHAVIPSGHTVIMLRPRVLRMVRGFLATGDLEGASGMACAEIR